MFLLLCKEIDHKQASRGANNSGKKGPDPAGAQTCAKIVRQPKACS